MASLYLIERIDDNCENSWGNDIGLVVCVDDKVKLQSIIETRLLKDNCGRPVTNMEGEKLTNKDIEVLYLGPADTNVKPGIILVKNAGA